MMTHDQYLATRRFGALDGVRAIAAVLVVFFHFGGPTWARANGWIGVHLFFVLSGFLITTLALREEARNGRVSLAEFYIRRVFRILPVYYVVIGVIVVYAYFKGLGLRHSGIVATLPWNVVFLGEYHQMPLFGQAWTLGVEQKFYLVWPLLAFGFGALAFVKRLSLSLGLVALMLALIPFMPYAGAYSPILIGCTLAIVLHHRKGFAALRVFTHPVVGLVVAAALIAVQTEFGEITAFLHDEGGSITGTGYVLLAALLVPSLVAGGPLAWVLSLKPMRFIGERSYSLYLVQLVIASVLGGAIPQFAPQRTMTAIAVTVVGLMAADLLYRWVELPMIDVGRRIIERRRAKKKAAPAAETTEPALAKV
ncbi:acyltransferase [Amycolatopsis sp. OK19-0408]|uniref:Acyltransferase n=1 Tax=Amycolatopsis iheyensis TaxID=2945988 RepID=A0A9X2SLG6_9PSEU|nr:acyltransferase [Amycolatopsis iheyensis]MCR6484555.1 acyltransferase [Amycolatopsis iheyensis]